MGQTELLFSDMTRSQIYLTSMERKFFKKIAYEREIPMSQAIREVLDNYIGQDSSS
jgi:hypothetical protein